MLRARNLLIALLLVPACAQSRDRGTVASMAPALGTADGGDRASHACEVVQRDVSRLNGEAGAFTTDCSSGTCLYQWIANVDVADAAWVDGATAHFLYHRAGDPTWWDATARPQRLVVPGDHRFQAVLSDHLFGPDEADAGVDIELVAYLAVPGGGRLFDHNVATGDFDNNHLNAGNGYSNYDNGVCQPQVAHVNFDSGYGGSAYNDLRQDGYLLVGYALDRLPQCRGDQWDTVAFARFSPGGQVVKQSVRSFENADGSPAAEVQAVPFAIDIPDDATAVEVWFENSDSTGCDTWDSNWGANYRYIVRGAPGNAARCDNTTLWVSSWAQPVCLGYDVVAELDADHCELTVDGVGHAYEGHYGIPHEWLDVYLHAGATSGTVENAGMWLRTYDADGVAHEGTVLGSQVSAGVFETGANLLVCGPMMPTTTASVDRMAFFIDVRRPTGEVVRLWQSRHGADYTMTDAFSLPTTSVGIAYGREEWANAASAVYDSRDACR